MRNNIISHNLGVKKRPLIVVVFIALVLIAAMALDTEVIKNGSSEELRKQVFSPDSYAQAEYPKIKDYVLSKAVDAQTFFSDFQTDSEAAVSRYGVKSGIGSIVPISFEGEVEAGTSGIYSVQVPGIPNNQTIRVNTGPVINGTALRDATGELKFDQFKNQIEYQNIGSALNRVMITEILSNLDQDTLVGKIVHVTGVFRLLNPQNWLVTPVRFNVE